MDGLGQRDRILQDGWDIVFAIWVYFICDRTKRGTSVHLSSSVSLRLPFGLVSISAVIWATKTQQKPKYQVETQSLTAHFNFTKGIKGSMYQEEGNSYESSHESLTFYWGRKSWWHLMWDGEPNKAGSIIIILEKLTNKAFLNFKCSAESWKWKQLMCGNKRKEPPETEVDNIMGQEKSMNNRS